MRVVHVTPGHAHTLRLSAREEPRCPAGSVKIRVLEAGLDGTDRDILEGAYGRPPRGADTLIIGHECLGIIEEAGSDVRGFAPGTLVVPTVRRPDNCPYCQRNEYDHCTGDRIERGISGADGFVQEYVIEAPEHLIRVPKRARTYAILTEPMAIVEKAIERAYAANSTFTWTPERALITGDGTIGLLAAHALTTRGLDVTITGLGADERKASILREAGITRYDAKRYPLSWIAHEHGRADLIIEATGSSAVALEAMETIGANGVVVLTSITPRAARADIGLDELNNHLVTGNRTVIGSVNASNEDFKRALATLHELEEHHRISKIITGRYAFEHVKDAIAAMPRHIKTVITIASGADRAL